jgi:glycosyltransferase involved in cell wall biosynthesis
MLTCVLIPHFDHFDQFRRMLPALVKQSVPLLVVDDASPMEAFNDLSRLLEEQAPGTTLIRHEKNTGKGGAVITGMRSAKEAGYTHVIQLDADGQHDVTGIALLIAESTRHPQSIICAQPMFDESISPLRFYSRYITLFFAWLETLSMEIRDAMCGFRSYPVNSLDALVEDVSPGTGMVFDPEILVRAMWAGIPLKFVPVQVKYPAGGKSHFRYFRDNLKISWMHIRLIAGMLIRLPSLLRRDRHAAAGGETP